jgi:hypothetical protein
LYQGYNYVGEILASHGYIVISVSADGINFGDKVNFPDPALAGAELLQHHLELWREFNTTGAEPFGQKFVGAVDLTHVGTMGHSQGGNRITRHFLLNKSQGSPFGLRALFPLAPFANRVAINNAALAVLLPYCDGDLSRLSGIQYYDDSRYNLPGDTGPKHSILVMGANHNYYNTEFPSQNRFDDDWFNQDPSLRNSHCGEEEGNRRLSPEEQQGTGIAYMTAFFRTYLGHELEFMPYLTATLPPPPSARTDDIFVSYHPAASLRRDVNRFANGTSVFMNAVGGDVVPAGLFEFGLCGLAVREQQEPNALFFGCVSDVDTRQAVPTFDDRLSHAAGFQQARAVWDVPTATLRNDLLRGYRDVSDFFAFQFRAGVNFTSSRNPLDTPQDLSVVLTDGGGGSASVRVGEHSRALFFPPGLDENVLGLPVPHQVLNTVQIPLSAFTGVDLTDIHSVVLAFDQTPTGDLLLADLAFVNIFPRKRHHYDDDDGDDRHGKRHHRKRHHRKHH